MENVETMVNIVMNTVRFNQLVSCSFAHGKVDAYFACRSETASTWCNLLVVAGRTQSIA